MKRVVKILPIFMFACLLVTGCFGSPKKSLLKASNKMSKLNSYQMTYNLTMGVKSQGIEMEVPIEVITSYNGASKAAKMDVAVTFFGMKVATEGYADYSDDKKVFTYTKNSTTGIWTKEETETSVDTKFAVNFIEAAEKVEKIKSDDKSVTHYQVTIKKEDMMELMKSSTDVVGTNSSVSVSEDSYEFSKDVILDVYVNKKSKYITKMTMDLTDSITMKGDDTAKITKFKLDFEFSKFNEVEEISIPEEAVKNAVDKKLTDAKEDMEDYLQTIELKYMLEDDIPAKITDTTLDKDGVVPEKVDVTLNKDGEVTSGTIVVNGFTGTIKDGKITQVK